MHRNKLVDVQNDFIFFTSKIPDYESYMMTILLIYLYPPA